MKRIILMGSPEFAVPCFTEICNHNDFQVVALYCQPDKKKGRGQKLLPPPCKLFAKERAIPIIQPETLSNSDIFEQYKSFKPDLTLVAAFGKILPLKYINFPNYGTYNIHTSLLPELRGAAPIEWAIVRGYKITGISIFKMIKELDAGDVIYKTETQIEDKENAGELRHRLSLTAKNIIIEVLNNIFDGNIEREKQNEKLATYAPKIQKADTCIDFNKSATDIYNFIRGFSPQPGAHTKLRGKFFKILKASIFPNSDEYKSTENLTIVDLKEGLLKIHNSTLKLEQVQMEGRKVTTWKEFLNGLQDKNTPIKFGE